MGIPGQHRSSRAAIEIHCFPNDIFNTKCHPHYAGKMEMPIPDGFDGNDAGEPAKSSQLTEFGESSLASSNFSSVPPEVLLDQTQALEENSQSDDDSPPMSPDLFEPDFDCDDDM